MKYQFKEGDGSHRDMTIEQCNIVLDRLRKQGYQISTIGQCSIKFPRIWIKYTGCILMANDSMIDGRLTNQIPFERWMEILDMNELEETANDFADLDRSLSISPSIKEHQRQCKADIMDCGCSEIIKNEIIAEMKEVLTHIPDNKLAGYPEKLRKLAEKLTKL
jgi:hypothetical protein